MKTIILGTTNPAKLKQISSALARDGISVRSVGEFGEIEEIVEDGKTVAENASKKAVEYANAIQEAVFSMDSGLYFDGIKEKEQPGLNVRRIPTIDKRPSDEEMLYYYVGLIKKYGGRLTGHWVYAVAMAKPGGKAKVLTKKSPMRCFVERISPVRLPGHPLHSIQIDPQKNKYLSELVEENEALWQDSVGAMIVQLLSSDE